MKIHTKKTDTLRQRMTERKFVLDKRFKKDTHDKVTLLGKENLSWLATQSLNDRHFFKIAPFPPHVEMWLLVKNAGGAPTAPSDPTNDPPLSNRLEGAKTGVSTKKSAVANRSADSFVRSGAR